MYMYKYIYISSSLFSCLYKYTSCTSYKLPSVHVCIYLATLRTHVLIRSQRRQYHYTVLYSVGFVAENKQRTNAGKSV